MADGKTHIIGTGIASTIGLGLSIPVYLSGINPRLILAFNAGLFVGNFITPDVDQETSIHPYFVAANILTFWIPGHKSRRAFRDAIVKFIESLWSFYSIPVSHRHVLTHLPLISTIIRILYMYFWWGFLFYNHNFIALWLIFTELLSLYLPETIAFTLGMSVQDFIHACLDGWRFHW